MAGRGLYSPNHDPENQPRRQLKSRKKNVTATPAPREIVPQLDLPVMDEAMRRQIRARQLLAREATISDPMYISELLQDGVQVPERHENELGPTVGPEVNPHQMGTGPGMQHMRPLPFDPDMNLKNDPDLRLGSGEADRFAAISAYDQVLQAFDQQLTQAFSAVRVLKQSAQQLNSRLQQERDAPDLAQIANEIANIIDQAVEPWLLEVEAYFDLVAEKTVEGEQV